VKDLPDLRRRWRFSINHWPLTIIHWNSFVTRFTDFTLPADDPNFPKPRGLLPVPPEVVEHVAREEARIEREHGFRIAPEARQRMLDYETLNWYYDDAYIAYRRTPQGVEVLVG
jgi:hypothetical protein